MFGIGRRGAERGSRQQCLDVEAGTSDDDRTRCAPLDVDNRGTRQPGKPARAEGLARVGHVDQVMGHMPLLGRRGFGRAHVQSAVDLPGVSGNNFDRRVLCQLSARLVLPLAVGPAITSSGGRGLSCVVSSKVPHPRITSGAGTSLRMFPGPWNIQGGRWAGGWGTNGVVVRLGPPKNAGRPFGKLRTGSPRTGGVGWLTMTGGVAEGGGAKGRFRARGGRRALSSLRAWSWGWGGAWRTFGGNGLGGRRGGGSGRRWLRGWGWRGGVVGRFGRVPGDRGSQAARSLGHMARSLGHRCGQALNPAPRDTMGGVPAFTQVLLSA